MLIILFLILPLFIIIPASILRVKAKTTLNSEIIFHTFFQVAISYSFWLLLFLQGFFGSILVLFIVLPLGLIMALVYFLFENEHSLIIDGVIKIEGIKNNILLLMITVLPLYIFMTILRFLPWYFEISLSLLFVGAVILLSILLRNKMELFWQKCKMNFVDSGPIKYVFIWGIFGLFLFGSMIFILPMNGARKALNLEQNTGYYTFDGLPVDIQNNYKQKPLQSLEISEYLAELLDGNESSFYILEDYLYTNRIDHDSSRNYIDVYSIENQILVNTHTLDFNMLDVESKSFDDNFIYHDGTLYFGDMNGLYTLDESICIKLSENRPYFFYDSGDILKVLFIQSDTDGQIYRLNGDSLILERTLTVDDYNQYGMFSVISYTLFYKSGETYFLNENPSVNFSDLSGYLEYDKTSETMYSVSNVAVRKHESNTLTTLLEYKEREIEDVGLYNGRILITDKKELEESQVIIFDIESEYVSIYNFTDNGDTILSSRNYGEYSVSFQNDFGKITYLQIDKLNNGYILQAYQIVEKPNDLKLPFYTHYGIFALIWVIVGIIIPVTDDIRYITYIDFESVTKKD